MATVNKRPAFVQELMDRTASLEAELAARGDRDTCLLHPDRPAMYETYSRWPSRENHAAPLCRDCAGAFVAAGGAIASSGHL